MSKRNRKPKTYTMRPPAKPKPERALESSAFGSTDFDRLITKWVELVFMDKPDPRMTVLGSGVQFWAGLLDPSLEGLNQCWPASLLVQRFLSRFGIESEIRTVYVDIESHGKVLDEVGSLTPHTREDGSWNGHSILQIPEMNAVLDLTIGQSRYLSRNRPYDVPLFFQKAEFGTRIADMSMMVSRRRLEPPLNLRYSFVPFDPEFEKTALGVSQVNMLEEHLEQLFPRVLAGLELFLPADLLTQARR